MRAPKHGESQDCHSSCRLHIEHLGVILGDGPILSDVSFHLHCGELVALIGPNGAGKSSLFKCILGQLPHSGTIRFETAEGTRMRPRIGYVPQSPAFSPEDPLSVLDFFLACISRYPVFLPTPQFLRDRVLECLDRVHGASLIDKRIGALSGGELQRVLLAVALEPLPNILILDEPLSGVDVDGMQLLLGMLDEIRARYDLSILLSTHNFSMLNRYVDKVLLLNTSLLAAGPPEQVLSSPAFRAAFHLFPEAGGGPV